MPFVITGCGRSGTGYTAKLLNALGVRTGHEEVFLPDERRPWGEFAGDVSCFAVPYLSRIVMECIPIIHLVRDPIRCCRSYAARPNLFHGPPSELDAYGRALWDFDKGPWIHSAPYLRCVAFWLRWNHAVESVADERVRIEDMDDPGTIVRLLGTMGLHQISLPQITDAIRASDTTFNTKPRDYSFAVQGLPLGLYDALKRTASRYGYAIPDRT